MNSEEKEAVEKHINKLLSTVAAEIRNPLSMVFEGIGSNKNPTPVMKKSYYSLLRLVGNLSAAEKLGSNDRLPAPDSDIAAICSELCTGIAPIISMERGLTLRYSGGAEHIVIACERTMIERLLLNLLSNSVKFTPDGGTITVSLKADKSDVMLTVTDTGCGIPPERLSRLFELYMTDTEPAPAPCGLGLGLPICRRIAEGYGGRIFVESGKGTRVTVTLPNRRNGDRKIEEPSFDYAGGYNHILVEMSDVLEASNYVQY